MSNWRRRLVLGTVLAAVGGIACAGALAYQFIGAAAVRQQVTSQLRKFFIGADVALGSAKFRLLGGVSVENFTLYRLDDPSRTPVLHVPSGIIYHDKEALAHGRVAVRKLLMQRPRLTVTRSADGCWNLAGILGPVHPELQIPIIEIEQGTIVIEIATGEPGSAQPASGGSAPFRIELRNVNATLLNQPRPVLEIQVHGEAVALGPIHAHATWHRTEVRLDAAADLAPVAVTTALLRDLARFYPGLADQVEKVAGVARWHAGVQYRGGVDPAWRHQVRLELTDGRLVHRALPLPLDNISISARCDDGVMAIDRLTAKAGPAEVALACQFLSPGASRPDHGALALPRSPGLTPHPATLIPAALDPMRSMDLTIKHLPISPELFTRLPAQFEQYERDYSPTGPLDLTVKLDRSTGPGVLKARLRPDGMAGKFQWFPYPVQDVRGSLDLTIPGDRPPRLELDLTAEATGRRPVTIQGWVEGDAPTPGYDITVAGDAVTLDNTLIQALPAKFQGVARTYHPQGRCDVIAHLSRAVGDLVPNQRFTVGFRGNAAVCYDLFPVPLDRLAGSLDITLGAGTPMTSNGTWLCKFNDIRAAYAGARIEIAGQARPTEDGTRVDLTIHGHNVPLDETLAEAFANPRMRLRPIWEMFRPTGRFDFTADVAHTDKHLAPAEYDIRVQHTGAIIRPTFFPLELADLTGSFRLTRGQVEVHRYTARHGVTRFDFGGGSVRFGDGWHYADVHGLRAEPLPINAELVTALPPALQSVFHALEPAGAIAVDLDHLVVDHPPDLPGPAQPPVYYWKGRMTFADAEMHSGVAWTGVTGTIASEGRYSGQLLDGVNGRIALDRATVFGQPLTGIIADAWVLQEHPHELRMRLVGGQLFGGRLFGEGHVAFGAGLQYEVDLKAINLQLEEAARHNHVGGNTHLSGLAKAELYLTGTGYGMDELGGGGNVHVPKGKMYNLPLVLDLLKVVTDLHAPDGIAFEEAHAEFKIQGKRVQVTRLDLLGSAISLGGKGEVDVDGSNLAMNFYAVWGHITQLLPPGLREVPPWLSKNLMLVKAQGKLGGQLTFHWEVVPLVVDPVRQLLDRMSGRNPGARAQSD
jgi:hypothetical protein